MFELIRFTNISDSYYKNSFISNRFPYYLQGPAEALKHDVEQGSMSLKDKLTIELQPDHRKGSLRYGDYVFNAKV